jgi:hypothetical protein
LVAPGYAEHSFAELYSDIENLAYTRDGGPRAVEMIAQEQDKGLGTYSFPALEHRVTETTGFELMNIAQVFGKILKLAPGVKDSATTSAFKRPLWRFIEVPANQIAIARGDDEYYLVHATVQGLAHEPVHHRTQGAIAPRNW